MPAYYKASLEKFVTEEPAFVLGKLAKANAAERFPLTPEAIDAWHAQLPFLSDGIRRLLGLRQEARQGHILLEYPIPLVGKRIDAVLLVHNMILVIETKTGTSQTAAMRQVDDYALNLACFHETSANRKIIPLVVSDARVAPDSADTEFDSLIEKCSVSSTYALGEVLDAICQQYLRENETPIDCEEWTRDAFGPSHQSSMLPLGCIRGWTYSKSATRAPLVKACKRRPTRPWKLFLMPVLVGKK